MLSLSNNFDVNWKSQQHFFCLTCCTGTSVIYIRIYVSKSSIKILFFSNQKVFFSNQLLNEHPKKNQSISFKQVTQLISHCKYSLMIWFTPEKNSPTRRVLCRILYLWSSYLPRNLYIYPFSIFMSLKLSRCQTVSHSPSALLSFFLPSTYPFLFILLYLSNSS